MKKLLLLALGIVAAHYAHTQTVYLADTAFVTDVGYGGAPASCKTNGMTYNSVNMDKAQGVWVADRFTVPTGATWTFDTVIIYGYQYGSSLSSPFTGCNLVILNGAPGLGGSVIWGDAGTNVLSSTAFTGIYKVDTFASDNGLMSTRRPIMSLKLYLSPAPHLAAGTYWLSWSATCAITTSSAATPYKVLPGRINPPGQVARVYSHSWDYIIDNGDTVGLNMMIIASAGLGVASVQGNATNMQLQNAPNPFSNTTTISYTLPEDGHVQLVVYNILGQQVATLADGTMTKGRHEVAFSAANLPAGTYYYKLSTSAGTAGKAMVVVR